MIDEAASPTGSGVGSGVASVGNGVTGRGVGRGVGSGVASVGNGVTGRGVGRGVGSRVGKGVAGGSVGLVVGRRKRPVGALVLSVPASTAARRRPKAAMPAHFMLDGMGKSAWCWPRI